MRRAGGVCDRDPFALPRSRDRTVPVGLRARIGHRHARTTFATTAFYAQTTVLHAQTTVFYAQTKLSGGWWFDHCLDPQQQPVLTAQNASLPPLTLKWWLGLQRSAGEPKTEEVIQKMFQVISSPLPDWKPQKTRCRKCAVVGNSGNLLGSKHGPLIDSHTSVIRMNKATTSGFEEDVGNRTTHHLIYPESAVDLRPGVHLVLLPFKLRDLQWVASALTTGEIKTTYMRVKERIQADKDKVIVVNPTFFKYTHDRWTERHGRYPSTGMLAIVFSLHVCDEVSVFGYGADHLGNWHHYWENNKLAGAFRRTGVHNGDFEMQVIEKLAAAGKIKLHKR
ncbi:hypothetical protein ANANG_G00253390 [Anguilla anguilla]|uniref:CMP-N-acetylneuraminate-beta-galactosamide-alpha-2,3-sialyltransferase 2 n=1 Tax=Anguilla anguilla TaxID=7936 RepID=A0A9D3LSP3_ANGAN|nr:hypothetical protein ANANG_G00253390 [Anguilla anguilla]